MEKLLAQFQDATKAGLLRTGPDAWTPLGFPAYLRQEVEMSLRRLGTQVWAVHIDERWV